MKFETPAIRVEWNLRRSYRRPLLDNQVRSAGYKFFLPVRNNEIGEPNWLGDRIL